MNVYARMLAMYTCSCSNFKVDHYACKELTTECIVLV